VRKEYQTNAGYYVDAAAGTSDIEDQEIANCTMLEHDDDALPNRLQRLKKVDPVFGRSQEHVSTPTFGFRPCGDGSELHEPTKTRDEVAMRFLESRVLCEGGQRYIVGFGRNDVGVDASRKPNA
jgi:hypothetical protein